ncbi:hypothetical protein TNCV_3139381 [Trichonephila clavipes]|nr:hypothetical protein TNCV_3139381 [Trichonephila clavipes]
MSLGNGTRSVLHPHIEIVAESLCGWACLRESVLIGGSNVASRRGFEIEDFLQYGFGNVQILSIRLCCGWSMALRETATASSNVVQYGRPIFDDFFQHLWPYIGNNTANVVFQMVKRLWLIRIDQ